MTTKLSFMLITLLTISSCFSYLVSAQKFEIKEATISEIKLAFKNKTLTSRQLVQFYLDEIEKRNPFLKGVMEVSPDALYDADKADYERETNSTASLLPLHGIPILLKGNIGTKGKLNTTSGSFALLGSVLPREALVVTNLKNAGAIIFGKATLSEWSAYRSTTAPDGWSARGGQAKNPYVASADTCGSSSGSAISTSANLVTLSLGTECDGSILCPASFNSVVGIKPTIGIVSMDQVVPISPRQDTVGPICRTVADAVYVLDEIVDNIFTLFIYPEGFKKYLKVDGLKGKRLGIVRHPFFDILNNTAVNRAFDKHFKTLRQEGAIIIDGLEIDNIDVILNPNESGETVACLAEFKMAINSFLKDLDVSPVRSLADVIVFNERNAHLEMTNEYGQDLFLASQATDGIGEKEKEALAKMEKLTKHGFEKLMNYNKLDALVTPGSLVAPVLAIGGFPGINVPAGYDDERVPFGINFSGLKFSEPKLIEIAYAFEQATKIRKPPTILY
ncbi:carbon-nitrogen ligase, with glutamine as amido-N-donor [Spatholobus suberectus]|nr:carbon-nitrogen ligase, with glutamine as amido-N-donor [Spatholobus suberectus]